MHSPLRWRNDVAQVSNRVDPVHTSDIRNLKQGRQSADKKCSIDIKVGKQGGEGMSSVNEKKKCIKFLTRQRQEQKSIHAALVNT